MLSGILINKNPLLFDVLGALRTVICVFMSLFVAGCNLSTTAPVVTPFPSSQSPSHGVDNTLTISTPTILATAVEHESPNIRNAGEVITKAIANLQNASSFQLEAHDVRAYKIIDPGNTNEKVIYGEFNAYYTVVRYPTLKVRAIYQYRYDPQDDFDTDESYTYRENGRYFTRRIEASIPTNVEETDLQRIEPMAGDVYQTLCSYPGQAKFISESDGIAVYIIDHPEWYKLESAAGFADLGFLRAQENGEQLVKQYVVEHYQNVKTIRFTIYVAVNEQLITKVVVDDNDFMVSIWAAVDHALIEQGEKPENLTRYEVMSVNGSEYFFSLYDKAQDFEIP